MRRPYTKVTTALSYENGEMKLVQIWKIQLHHVAVIMLKFQANLFERNSKLRSYLAANL